jgi:hypothetical protein
MVRCSTAFKWAFSNQDFHSPSKHSEMWSGERPIKDITIVGVPESPIRADWRREGVMKDAYPQTAPRHNGGFLREIEGNALCL